jgi:membrane-bound ClpP family serine protease
MQAGMIGFGALIVVAVGAALLRAKKMLTPLLPIALYGLAVLLCGFYCTAPIDPAIPYSVSEARIHSLFATIAGLSLSLAILWSAFASRDRRKRLAHVALLITVIGLSALFNLAESDSTNIGTGTVQRLLYLSGFVWLVYQGLSG